ncbi:DUF4245 domain-containing protein [Aeromicrobium chenweiae]|nr:DUF4245 domain-containing protein [Aeromicrobium chenweiae]
MSSPASSRGNPSMGDVLRSVAVIGLIVLVVWAFGRIFFTNDVEKTIEPIDYAKVVEQARPAASFELLAPTSLPKGWEARSARFDPQAWHLGVFTDSGDYIGLEQIKTSVDRAVDRFAEGSKPAGTAEVDGRTWKVRSGPKGRWIYVRGDDGVTTLINSSASRKTVESYISSLSTS